MGLHPHIGLLAPAVFDGRARQARHLKGESWDIRHFLPEMRLMANLAELPVPARPGEEWGVAEQLELAHTIRRAASTHDGFIVIHPWRSMTMTAAFLAMALSGIKKPIACMGPHPSTEETGLVPRADMAIGSYGSRAYFMNVMQVVTYGYRDVMIIDGSRVYRAVRMTTTTLGSTFALEPYRFDAIGNIDVGFSIAIKEPEEHTAPRVRRAPVVATWAPFVPHEPSFAPRNADGLFVDCSHVSEGGEGMQREFGKQSVPVLWYGHPLWSSVGGIIAPDTTREVAFAKFALSLGAGASLRTMQGLLNDNWRGEL